jgi:hypothetical protein
MHKIENVPAFRAGKMVRIGRPTLTPTETTELRRLFDLVADTCDAAGQLLAKAGAPPLSAELQRLRDLRARAEEMVESIKAILD